MGPTQPSQTYSPLKYFASRHLYDVTEFAFRRTWEQIESCAVVFRGKPNNRRSLNKAICVPCKHPRWILSQWEKIKETINSEKFVRQNSVRFVKRVNKHIDRSHDSFVIFKNWKNKALRKMFVNDNKFCKVSFYVVLVISKLL